MTPLQEQYEILKTDYPEAVIQVLPSGAALIFIPKLPLPAGWSKPITEIRFVAPVGYPFAKPDCFWTDADLRLQGGGIPQNVGNNAIPEVSGSYLWFSWHVAQWNPNKDNLTTYMRVIENRLKALR